MSSCAASCCICFPKVSCASETLASWPIASVPPLCHFAFNCLVQHHKPSKRSPPPVPAIFGLAPSAVGRCWSSKDLRLLRSSCVLHRPGMPSRHEQTVDITKSFACFGSLPLFLSFCPTNPSSPSPRTSFGGTFACSATLFLSRLGSLLRYPSPEHRQTHSSPN